jgi:hypothetical protein
MRTDIISCADKLETGRNYIFCPSYPSVFFALHLKNSGKEIKIITHNISVKKYCSTADIDCIYFDSVDVFPYTRLYKIFILKSRIDNLIKKMNIKKEDKFFLLDNSFDINTFYLAKECSKKGNVYFNVLGKIFNTYTENKYLSLSFFARTGSRYLFKMFLGLDLIFLEVHSSPIFGIGNKFLKKNKIKNFFLNKKLKELQLDAMRKSHINLKEYDNLIATDGNISGIVNGDSLIKVHKNLLKMPYNFAIKYHPHVLKTQKLAKYEKVLINCDEFPDYIPVELLLISIYSTSLISASQLDHLEAISLLELVEWNNQSYKKEVKAWLIKESNNRIIFVKTFEELNKVLEA